MSSTTSPATSSTTTTQTTAAPTTNSPPAPSATLEPLDNAPPYESRIVEIDDAIAERFTHSWREGCPVGLDQLRLITITHWNYTGARVEGELVVHVDAAQGMAQVFGRLYDARFPIERMELVDAYAGDDDQSMAANNTSAFNCREVAWKPGVWSNHALGLAVDINPLVNPYVSTSRVLPPEGAAFTDRSVEVLGGIYANDVVTAAFTEIGWTWGGTWSSAKDYQHFSASGG